MRIAVLGTGTVGRTLAARLHDLGHDVALGTRDPVATMARADPPTGGPGFAAWHEEYPGVALTAFVEVAEGADLVVNATNGASSLAALGQVGAETLAGRVLLDIANPLDFSSGMPPTLLVKDTDSLGEQIQRAFPDARVVKALNTMNAEVMVDPARLGQSSSVFVAGDDPGAKQLVSGLLESMGHDDVIDLGDISGARGPEMLLPLWLRLWGSLGTGAFNVKVVR